MKQGGRNAGSNSKTGKTGGQAVLETSLGRGFI